jgi:hypothetical protein
MGGEGGADLRFRLQEMKGNSSPEAIFNKSLRQSSLN